MGDDVFPSFSLCDMVLPAMAVGVLCLVKGGAVMGTYSCKNYDENIKSAWEKENSLPGTDGIPREVFPCCPSVPVMSVYCFLPKTRTMSL